MRIFNILQRTRQTKGWIHRNAVMGACVALILAGGIGGYMALADSPKYIAANVTLHTSGAIDKNDLLSGQWGYLPGSKQEDGGLLIKPDSFQIVKQDGSGGQANPPVNEYGTHLENATDFTITAQLADVAATGKAAMQLYGQVPIIADEFRVERKSVRVELDGNNLNVNLWDGSKQTAALTQSLPLATPIAKDARLEVTHAAGKIQISVNGQQVTEIDDSGVFADGFVWFGFDATGSSFKISNLDAKGVGAATFKTADSSTLRVQRKDPNGLQSLAAKKRSNFTVGAAMALPPTVSDASYANAAFGGNFGALTTENAMKWQFIEPQQGVFDFKEGDALVQLAKRHDMKVQGHTLVFGEANPAWVRNLPAGQLEAAMTNHIKKTLTHFKGNVYSWDVVNEPFSDDQWDQFRTNIWYNAMGESYISKAFTTAHDADPGALLFMNEYGIEEDGDRWNAFLALVTKLKAGGVPIDGVGFQSHVYQSSDKIDPAVLRKHIQQLAAIGVKSRVSEMDVYSDDGQSVQASQYSAIFQACLDEPGCISWTTWGISDRYDYFIDDDGSIQQGNDFLWNDKMKPTPAFGAVQKLLQ
ncbi:MAG TPA: endo-1,4-beta-xylanase [Candidatus Saccharimonadales bacterium]|jgi:endo-1,4-beta-xylanase|nr:endo-1,4-beta-xylanase [Candidatus Saccharimonadales bacterium]